jgi:hypothetical protein
MVPVVTVTGSGTNPSQNDKLMVTFENTAGGSGYSGYSGFGVSGYSGYSGSGLSGYSGYSGSGLSGYSGYSGSGLSGYSGYSGSGLSGYSGYSSTSGYSGYSSVSGFSGYSGSGGGAPGSPTTSIQYNNAGAFGGSANYTWTNASNLVTLTGAPASNTVADGLLVTDTTAATAANQQYSPAIHFTGQGWKTTATAASQTVDWRAYVVPVQGAANPTSQFTFDNQVNAGGYTNAIILDSSGNIILSNLTGVRSYNGISNVGVCFSNGRVRIHNSSNTMVEDFNDSGFELASSQTVVWNTSPGVSAADTGLARNAAGVVEVNNATIGSLAFLKADRINANGSQPSNASTAAVSAGYASDTYLAGSSVTINTAGAWRAGGAYHLIFDMAKSAAGTGTPVLTVRMGTLGTTADFAALTITFPAGTAAIDTGIFELWVNFRSVGSGTSAVIQGVAEVRHNNTNTGLVVTGTGSTEVVLGTSAGFNSSTATVLGVSFNGGTSFSGTNTLCQAQLIMP